MTVISDLDEPPRRFDLPDILDISAAEPLLLRLHELSTGDGPVLLGGADVARLSTPCAQVLVAALNDSEARFYLDAPSEALLSAFTDLGLLKHIEERVRVP